MIGASKIIGIDTNNTKKEWGDKFGMTDFINPNEIKESVVDHIIEITDGGVDFSFECIGKTQVMRDALECTHKGWGESIIIGVAGAVEHVAERMCQK